MKHCTVGYGNFYDLINTLDITDLNLIRGVSERLYWCQHSTFELPYIHWDTFKS